MKYGFHPKRVLIIESQPPVFQNGALLFYVSSGSGGLWINGMKLPLSAGSFGWLHTYHIYQFEPEWGGKLELLVCPFDYASASYVTYQDSLKITRTVMTEYSPVVTLGGEEADYIENLMEEFLSEGAGAQPMNIVEGYSLFLELSTLFLRYSAREALKQEVVPFERNLAWKLLAHIFTYSNENLTREKLAAAYGVTEREVSSQLNLVAGQSFASLLNRARIDRACDMMYFGGLTMHYISRYVGYRSDTSFYRAFRAILGKTPQEYQNSMVSGMRGEPIPIEALALSILGYLFGHYEEPLTVADVAKALYLEKNSVNDTLVNNFGMDFSAILTELRMKYAEVLLQQHSMPAADIALICGYNSTRTFHRVFTERHGMTPGEYRKYQVRTEYSECRKGGGARGMSVRTKR